jgi:hypothetical protein
MVQTTLEKAVRDSIATKTFGTEDRGIAMLAIYYAEEIDLDSGELNRLGPKLQAALESLGLTPLARARMTKKVNDDDKPTADPLDELDARRSARLRNAAPVDSAVTAPDS